MSSTIIAENKSVTKIHIVWDGIRCFLNQKKNGRIVDDATPITIGDAEAIVKKAQANPSARDISSRGIVSFDYPKHQWSWMATVIEDDNTEEPDTI